MSKKQQPRRSFIGGLFDSNTFTLVFCFTAAIIAWFVAMANSDENRTYIVYDVPINVNLSAEAEAEGLRVFNMTYGTADIEVSGSSLITNKLTPEDFNVAVSFNPTSTKLTGNTLQKMTAPVRVTKNSTISDYTVVSVNPEEINIDYDRYKESVFTIENELQYSADTAYYPGTPVFSEESITISGPESSVNKISRVAVAYSIDAPLKHDESISCPVRLYDQENKEITDTSGMYLELSVDTVQVDIPIMARKTVKLVANFLNRPESFPEGRITIEPAQIDIAGEEELLSGITEVQLDTVIDFADLYLSSTPTYTVDIGLPTGVRNITASGETTLTQATVSVNLNGYQEAQFTVPDVNIQMLNVPAGKEASLAGGALSVSVMGPQAQIMKLLGDDVLVHIDLTNVGSSTGHIEVPFTVSFTGTMKDSCWVVGSDTVTVTLQGATAAAANSPDLLEAEPQE